MFVTYFFGDLNAVINVEKTRELYTSFEQLLPKDHLEINFVNNLEYLSEDLEQKLDDIGICPLLYRELDGYFTTTMKRKVYYTACYPFVAKNQRDLVRAIRKAWRQEQVHELVVGGRIHFNLDTWEAYPALCLKVKFPYLLERKDRP
jgi:hypothetical protein